MHVFGGYQRLIVSAGGIEDINFLSNCLKKSCSQLPVVVKYSMLSCDYKEE